MKTFTLVIFFISVGAFATELDPIAKAKLAIIEGQIVQTLVDQRSNSDSRRDVMCLRLGRFSAILKRIAGSHPLPPEEMTRHYRNYESFCGWDSFEGAPRGDITTLKANLVEDLASLRKFVRE